MAEAVRLDSLTPGERFVTDWTERAGRLEAVSSTSCTVTMDGESGDRSFTTVEGKQVNLKGARGRRITLSGGTLVRRVKEAT